MVCPQGEIVRRDVYAQCKCNAKNIRSNFHAGNDVICYASRASAGSAGCVSAWIAQ
jgi:hypothetical protein